MEEGSWNKGRELLIFADNTAEKKESRGGGRRGGRWWRTRMVGPGHAAHGAALLSPLYCSCIVTAGGGTGSADAYRKSRLRLP